MKKAACLNCESRLDLKDDVIECSTCGLVMKVMSLEPPTLQISGGWPIRNKIVSESHDIYKEEMAKIRFPPSFKGHATLIEIDISKQAAALRFLRLAEYLLVISCCYWLMGVLAILFLMPSIMQERGAVIILSVSAALLFGTRVGYKHMGVIDNRIWWAYAFILPILILLLSMITLLSFIVVEKAGWDGSTILLFSKDMFHGFFGVLIALSGFISLVRLFRMKLTVLGIRLTSLLSNLRSHRCAKGYSTAKIKRINKPLGILFRIMAVIIFLSGMSTIQLFAVDSKAVSIIRFLFTSFVSLSFLVVARGYLQFDAVSLLSVDKRKLVLFLRSFDDDENRYNKSLYLSLLDFALETRLSKHFMHFGPFVAIGLTKEAIQIPGAARVRLSHREWLQIVSDWMSKARLLVMYAGKTNWVTWELAKLIEMGRIQDLMLLIPPTNVRDRSIQSEEVARRFDRMKEVFKNTEWSESLVALQSLQDTRALLFRSDGRLIIIRSRSGNRDSYHLAALVAHYIILNKDVAYRPIMRLNMPEC